MLLRARRFWAASFGLLASVSWVGCGRIAGLGDFRAVPEDAGGTPDVGGPGGASGVGGGAAGGATGGTGGGVAGQSGIGGAGGSGGTAIPPCTATQLDCDGIPSNGCEADTVIDDAHCGSCDRDCLGADCVGGVCAPTEIGFGSSDVTVDDTHVYWTVNAGGGGCKAKVYRCALPECATAEPFAQGDDIAYGVVADATDVWWGVGSGFARRPKTAECDLCEPAMTTACAVVDAGSPRWWLAQDATHLYWIGYTGGLFGWPKSGGVPTTLDPEAHTCQPAVSDGRIFYCRGSGIWTCDLGTGCADPALVAEPVSTESWMVWEIAARDGVPYWVEEGGRVFGCETNDCGKNPKVITSKPGEGFVAITADADGVYFASRSGRVYSCPLSGCVGEPLLLTGGTGQPREGAIAADSIYVYVSGNKVYRVAK